MDLQWFSMVFVGFVQSADRFADSFVDRIDDLYGFAMLFNSVL